MKRSDRNADAEQFYGSKMWKVLRKSKLMSVSYFCERCLRDGVVRAATSVHHKQKIVINGRFDLLAAQCHGGNLDELEALCSDHHAIADSNDPNRPLRDVGLDGWPLDPAHPANKGGTGGRV